jgi:leader peptidase (prepilin peptidase)/N-methyltransferase
MWMTWNIGQTGAMLAAAVFALALAALLGRAAYRLPRALEAQIASEPSRAHRRYRASFWTAGPVLAMLCAWHFGPTPAAAAAILYMVTLLALAWIDAETGLLPDMLSLPLLWLGLLVNLNNGFTPLPDAVLGAVAGYLALWCVCRLFLLLTGRIGMGDGDFKLLAALGAWLGWMSLPWVLLVSSSLALAVALGLRLAGRMKAGDSLRFGPYLAGAGILALLRL